MYDKNAWIDVEPMKHRSKRQGSEGVNEFGASEQIAQTRPIKAQSAAVARATARIGNAEWACLGRMSGHGGFGHAFSVLHIMVGALICQPLAMAGQLPLAQQPAGEADRAPAPNVILSLDDSSSMDFASEPGSPKSRMDVLKETLTDVFSDTTLIPDGKLRVGWQIMNNWIGLPGAPSTLVPGGANSIRVMDAPHRARFLAFVGALRAWGYTPSQRMFRQAYTYMKTPPGIDSPWAAIPGVQAAPFLSCRRAYHIFMTDGRWNYWTAPDFVVGDYDSEDHVFPDGVMYSTTSPQTRIYRNTGAYYLGDWALKGWAEDLQPSIPNDVQPTSAYRNAPAREQIGGQWFDKYWNPKYDPSTWQNLTTYSIGYSEDAIGWNPALGIAVPTQLMPLGWDGSFPDLMTGAKTWPSMTAGPETNRGLDNWHAAINGRGRYYAVTTNDDLRKAFRSILLQLADENSSNVAGIAAVGSSYVYENANVYSSGYNADRGWVGHVYADIIDTNGVLSRNPDWGFGLGTQPPSDHKTTGDKLDALSNAQIASRVILTTRDTTGTGVPFRWRSDESTMSAAQKALISAGDKLGQDRVDFLRGDTSKEVSQVGGVFRRRQSRQGDIVNSGVWYVGEAVSDYSMVGYAEFRAAQKNRRPMIYVGGNDGMLHGFSATDGTEKMAYVPQGLIGKLEQLTRVDYSHKYFVDNTPFAGDVNRNPFATTAAASDWRTMLAGTLGAGGRGYFILDVTNPAALTEANAAAVVVLDKTQPSDALPDDASDDADIGHIFAAPVLSDSNPLQVTQFTRMNDGRMAVVFGNGYNSKNERPVLLVQYLDGAKELRKVLAMPNFPPRYGFSGANNGLSAPRLVDLNGDGAVDIVYAGDLKGNLWKFDLTSPDPAQWRTTGNGNPIFRAGLATSDTAAARLAITAPPTVKRNSRGPVGMMVAFGTGQNLTVADRSATQPQAIFSVLDNASYRPRADNPKFLEIHPGSGPCPGADCVAAPEYIGYGPSLLGGQPGGLTLLEQTISATPVAGSGASAGQTFWTVSENEIDWARHKGWYMRLPDAGERALKQMPFFDSSNILMLYSQVPATGTSSTSIEESCQAPVTGERQRMTLLNIMDGKPPSISLMDRDGDGYYNVDDGKVSSVRLAAGATTMASGARTVSVLAGSVANAPVVLRRFPETPLRPSWRQMQ